MEQYTREQYEAALDALGLDVATTATVYIAPDWVRVEHTDRPPTSMPM